ncbi:MAG: hypothetical protein ACK5UQ_22895 [Planctomycetota bacterium]
MASIDEAAQIAADLPGVTTGTSYGNPAWFVDKKAFAWLRPFSKADLRRYGDAPVPTGPIFAVRVGGLPEKDAVLAKRSRGVFTIPHLDGYAAVLLQLDVVATSVLRRLIKDAWLACAGPATVAGYGVRRAKPRR